jgi:hypothetical protein
VRAQGDGGSLCARAGAGIGPMVTASGVGRGGCWWWSNMRYVWLGEGGNSGALLRVCRVRRSVSALRELQGTLAGVSWTYFAGGNAARIALSAGMWGVMDVW